MTPQCGKPSATPAVMGSDGRYHATAGPCKRPAGHDGDCSPVATHEEQAGQQQRRIHRFALTSHGYATVAESDLLALERDAAFTQRAMEALAGFVARQTLDSGRCTECGNPVADKQPTAGCEVCDARALLHEYESREQS